MSIRSKKKRRLIYLAALLVVLGVVGAAGYAMRSRQIRSRLVLGRAEGVAALASGNYNEALHKIGSYLQRNEDDAEAIYQYAQAREQVPMSDSKHVGQAIAQYRRLLVLQPTHTAARRRLLKLYSDYGFTQEAIDTAAKLQAADPDDPDALRATAIAQARLRAYPQALNAAKRYNELVPDDLDIQRLTFEVLLAKGTPATEIVARAQALQDKYPSQPRFQLLTGIAYRVAGDAAAARDSIRKAAAQQSDNDPRFVRSLVEQLEALELFEESLRVLGRAADLGAAENRRLYVGRLFQAERYLEVADRLRELDPSDPRADAELLALRAMALFNLNRAGEMEPVVGALGKRFDVGAEAWRPVLQTVPRTTPAPPRDVIRVCTESLRRAPNNPYFHHFVATAYSAAGEMDHAIQHWAEAIRYAPAWAAPRARIASLYLAAGRPDDALVFARSARDRASNDAGVLQTFAEALAGSLVASRGATNPALADELSTTAKQIATLNPSDDVAVAFGAVAHAAAGRKDQAVSAVRAALDDPKDLSDTAYIRLASVSQAYGLGLEEACLARGEKAVGRVTPTIATHRARMLLAQGKAADGRKVLRAAGDSARTPAEIKTWRAAWAAFLDATSDPEARQAWTALANDFPEDAGIQSVAVRADCLKDDRAFLERTIDRLRDATSPDAVAWRMARARWLASGATGEKKQAQLAAAASLLAEVSRDMPELPEPRILLARCLKELDNPGEAIHQLSLVVSSSPQRNGARLELAGLLQAQGDYAAARTQLDAVASDPSATPQDRMVAASLLARGGDVDQAAATLGNNPPPSLLLADLYRRRGDSVRAKEVCEKLLEKNADPAVIGLLADVLASEGRPQQAEQALARLDAAAPPAPQKELIRGRFYAAHGEPSKALEQFTAATRAAPANTAGWRLLAKQYLAGGNLSQALAAADGAAKASAADDGLREFRKVAASLPGGADAVSLLPLLAGVLDTPTDAPGVIELLNIVANAAKNPSSTDLSDRLRDLAKRYPRSLTVQNVAARTLVTRGGDASLEHGLTLANRAMVNFPGAAEPAEIATGALVILKRWDDAAVTAAQWKRRVPDAPGADIVIASAHLVRREPDKARAVLERYVPRGPAGTPEKPYVTQATVLYAQALASSGEFAEVEKLLCPRLDASAQYRSAWIDLAARRVADFAVAARWLDLAAALPPLPAAQKSARAAFGERATMVQAWHVLAQRSGSAAHKERAASLINDLVAGMQASSEVNAGDMVVLGILCEEAGNRATAEKAYRSAVEKNPVEPIALNNLAMILADSGNAVEAEKYAADAAKLEHPRRASFFDTLATVQGKSEHWTRAADSIRRALELEPSNVGFQIHRAVILAKAGDPQAKQALETVEGIRLDDSRLSNTDRERLKSLLEEAASGA